MNGCAAETAAVSGYGAAQCSGHDYQGRGMRVKEQVSLSRRMTSDLTIQTREGDVVTLSSGSFTDISSFTYDRRGRIASEEGVLAFRVQQQAITLRSGQRLEFSVKGDLNAAELADIEEILSGVDGIMQEMAGGDMESAVEKALMMGGYDTVSAFTADMRYESTFRAVSETRLHQLPQKIEQRQPDLSEKIRTLSDRLKEELERPLESLFSRHLGKWGEGKEDRLEKVRDFLASVQHI